MSSLAVEETTTAVTTETETEGNGGLGRITNIQGPDTIQKRSKDKDSKNIPFRSDAQKVAGVHIAHQKQNCVSRTAAFRVLGMFPTEQKAKRHLEKIGSALPGFTVAAHTWWPILRENPTDSGEAQKIQIRTVDRVQKYIKSCEDQNNKIMEQIGEEHAEDRYKESLAIYEKKHKLEMDLKIEDEKAQGLDDDADIEISRSDEVRGQNWCAVSIVCDPDLDDEPCINVLRAFEERSDCEDYVRNTCLEEDVVTKCYSVRMYEWVHPALIHTKKFFDTIKTSYSYTELEELHSGKAEERRKIEKILASHDKTPEDVFREVGALENAKED